MSADFPVGYFTVEQFVFARLDEDGAKPGADLVKIRALRMLAAWHSIWVDTGTGVSYWRCATCAPTNGAPCITLLLVANMWADHPDLPDRAKDAQTFDLGQDAADAGGWFALVYPERQTNPKSA